MKFTVHHTCRKDGGEREVLKNFPYLSEYKPEEGKKPFLGEGYYFWDYNFEYAKYWGKSHCNSQFYVCEVDITIDHEMDGFYLDLAGNRKDLVGFVELLDEFNLIHPEGTQGIDLCYIIDYLRSQCPEEAFPYEVIRAVDYRNADLEGIKIVFNEDRKNFTMLNPRILISFKNKQKIVSLTEPIIKFAS
ncbi:MAG: hypothetical protein IPM74_12385 [Crocinitomicaceae bacterium]|nr:hypothetical protein [Crocinitomicaceae bacterium]MBK8926673.1 hypothetical protein [Crocinitomicaceae bacterium]